MRTQIAAMVVSAHLEDLRKEAAVARVARRVRKEARRSRTPLISLEALILSRRARKGAVVDAACHAAGIERVSSPSQMAHLLQAMVRTRMPMGTRVAIVADGGGQASVASDSLVSEGLEVPEFSRSLKDALRRELPSTASVSNPVDVAGGGEQDIASFARLVRHLVSSHEVDSTLVTGFFGGYGSHGPELAQNEVDTAMSMASESQANGGTTIVQTMHWKSRAAGVLRSGGIPVYRGIDEATWVLARMARRRLLEPTGVPTIPDPAPPITVAGYFPARRILEASGIQFPRATEVATKPQLIAAMKRLRFPVALKALGDEHKSDRGGVILGLRNLNEVVQAWDQLAARLAPPTLSIEEMVDMGDAVELIIGVRRDARFGPVALVGLGGVYSELLRDVRCALAPVSENVGRSLLYMLRGSALLAGARGRPSVDMDAIAKVIARVSATAAAHPEIAEIECNPVVAMPCGAIAVDARIVLSSS